MATQNQIQQYYEQFVDTVIAFNTFALKKTGIVQGQTVLKIDTYNLICVPYQMTMKSITLLLSLSKDELVFFSKYVNSHAGLTIVFELSNSQKPLQLFARCVIKAINSVKGRDSVGLLTVEFKPIPQDMIIIMGDYILSLERLKVEFSDYSDKLIRVTPESAKAMGFNNYAVFSHGSNQLKLALFEIASNRANALLPPQTQDLAVETKGTVKLFFQKYQFSTQSAVLEWTRMPTGVVKAGFALVFSPELVEIIEQFNFTARMSARKTAQS